MADQTRETGPQGADIVTLSEVARDFRFPLVTELEAYWDRLRGTRLVPARSEVDPRQIEDALEYAFIVERVAPGMARFRLAGMHLSDLMGMEVRGMPVTAFFTPEARKTLSEVMEQVFDSPAVARLSLSAETGVGRPGLEARLLLLPLKSDFGDVSRALGCLVTNGPVGRAPRRFSIAAEEVSDIAGPQHAGDRRIKGWSRAIERPKQRPALGSVRENEPARPPSVPKTPALLPGLPHRASGARPPKPERGAGRPHLYLVKSDS